MAELDNLSIEISVSTRQAEEGINRLANSLTTLNNHLGQFGRDNDYSRGLEKLTTNIRTMADALDRIDGAHIKDIAKGLGKIAQASEKMANLSGLTKGVSQIQKVPEAVKSAVAEIKRDWNLGADADDALTKSVMELQAAVGNDAAWEQASENVRSVIKDYAKFEDQAYSTGNALKEALKNSSSVISIPKGYKEEVGDNETFRALRGRLGFSKSAKKGNISAGEFMVENKLAREEDLSNEIDDFSKLMNMLSEVRGSLLSYDEALKEHLTTSEEMEYSLDRLAEKFGHVRQEMATSGDNDPYIEVPDDDDFFDSFDISGNFNANMSQTGAIADSVVPKVNAVADSFNRLAMEGQVAETIDPLSGIADSLERLSALKFDDSINKLEALKKTVSALGNTAGANAATRLPELTKGLDEMSNVVLPHFAYDDSLQTLASGLRSLGSKTVVAASTSIKPLADGMKQLNDLGTVKLEGISELASAVRMFGLSSATKAADNLPKLAQGFTDLIIALNKAPKLRADVSNLAGALSKVSTVSRSLPRNTTRAGKGLNLFGNHAKTARKHTLSLAAAIGKLYASYWLLLRGVQMAYRGIEKAADLVEVQNVVDVTFGDARDKVEEFAESSIEAFGMSELATKEIASRYQAMGQAMAIPLSTIRATSDFVNESTHGYAKVTDSLADVSLNVTKLAADMASLYNMEVEDVAEKLEAIWTGQTRPLRTFGLDLTQASLSAFALRNGLNADISSMTQAEKTMLRYQYVMANTGAAHGDFQRTMGSWANQIKIAKMNLEELQIVLGKIGMYTFKPLVKAFNSAMSTILHNAEGVLNSLGKIFGWQIEISDVGIAQDAEDIADGYDDATGAAKKFKNFLLGIDELNLLPDNDNGGGGAEIGAAADGMDDLGVKIKETDKGFESIYDTLFKLGFRIGEVELDFLKKIPWDKVIKKARAFGKGFAEFLNGYLKNVELFYEKGKFLAMGINTVFNALDAFFDEFDGFQLGVDIGAMINGFFENLDWAVIESAVLGAAEDLVGIVNGAILTTKWDVVGQSIAKGLNLAVDFALKIISDVKWVELGKALATAFNAFFDEFDAKDVAKTITKGVQGAFDFVNTALEGADFDKAGSKLGEFFKELNLLQFADDLAKLIGNLFVAAFKIFGATFSEAPIEATLLAIIAGLQLKKATGAAIAGIANWLGIVTAGGVNSVSGTASGLGSTLGQKLFEGFKSKAGFSGLSLGQFLTTDIGALASNATLLGKAGLVGTAIAGSILAAIYGFDLGKKIGKAIFPEDAQWYDNFSWKEFFGEAPNWGAGIQEAFKRTDFDANIEIGETVHDPMGLAFLSEAAVDTTQTWNEFVHSVEQGKTVLDSVKLDNIKSGLEEAGYSAITVNGIMNDLRQAQYAAEDGQKALNSTMETGAKTYHSVGEMLGAMAGKMVETAKSTEETKNKYATWADVLNAGTEAMKTASKEAYETASGTKGIAETNAESSAALVSTSEDLDAVFSKMSEYEGYMSGIGTDSNTLAETLKTDMGSVNQTLSEMVVDFTTNSNLLLSDLKQSLLDFPAKISTAFVALKTTISNSIINAYKEVKAYSLKMGKMIDLVNGGLSIIANNSANKTGNTSAVYANVAKYETGGFPEDGLFFANHNEMVGTFSNGQTAVANNAQIVAGIKAGVYEAVVAAMSGANTSVNVELNGSAADFFSAMVKENNRSLMMTGASPLRT